MNVTYHGKVGKAFQFTYGRFGLLQNPVGAQVVMTYLGCDLMGDVRSYYRDDATGAVRLRVTHFNGEPWPLEPVASAVVVLERTYDDGRELDR